MSTGLRVLVAGAAGALGRHVTRELVGRDHEVSVLLRSSPLDDDLVERVRVVRADALDVDKVDEAVEEAEVVFSSLGASVLPDFRRGRASFDRIDVPANLNLIEAAERGRGRRFVYVSVAGHEEFGQLAYVAAHEAVVAALRGSSLTTCIIRPPGFYSAFLEVLRMARKGSVPIIGDGSARTNPIDDRDLAAECADAVESDAKEVVAGGPETLTRRRIVELAFESSGKPVRSRSLPPRLVRAMVPLIRPINPRVADLTAFYEAVSTRDLVVPQVGRRTLADFFRESAEARSDE